MRTITVERLIRDGPFHIGEYYDVARDDGDGHVHGVIRGLLPTGPNHVNVTVELVEGDPPSR